MITITKQIAINPGAGETGPYTYTWSADTSFPGCVSFSPTTTGVITNPSSQTIITDINFLNSSCIDDTTVTLTITYNGGECTKQFNVSLTNPCEEFSVDISASTLDGYIFTAVPTNGTGPFTYNWGWDDDYFTPAGSSTGNVLKLLYMGGSVPPAQSTVFLTVEDQNGCSYTTSVDFTTCSLSFDSQSVILQCQPDGSKSAIICMDPKGCATSLVDWTTLSDNASDVTVSLVPFTIGQIGSNFACYASGGRRVKISVPAGTYPYGGSVGFYINVATTTGVTASMQVSATIPACNTPLVNQVSITAQAPFQIDCSYTPGSTYEIGPVTDFINIYAGGTIDWTSFKFVELDTGNETAGPLTTTLAGTVAFNNATKMIEYTVPAATGTDSFKWTICDTAGNCAQSQIYAIVLDCILEPTAVADSECATCGVAAEHDVLTNDTINGVLYNLEVTSSPTYGSAVFNGDFSAPRILYTANPTYAGADSYEYTITNDSGQTDSATVTVNVLCAGTDADIHVCE